VSCYRYPKKKALYKAKSAKNKVKKEKYIIGVFIYKEDRLKKKAKKELEC